MLWVFGVLLASLGLPRIPPELSLYRKLRNIKMLWIVLKIEYRYDAASTVLFFGGSCAYDTALKCDFHDVWPKAMQDSVHSLRDPNLRPCRILNMALRSQICSRILYALSVVEPYDSFLNI